ncbi:hypothetical protein Y032_0005g2263 [Ancylostoma ceylanicum]|uniref:Transmembrane protein n=1 Tax=Ancylostoma ceylanicum TaxID=53326 RepID=A0A016VQT5_9BILA|nr:hypothetical protein Y032_0005g2263 [Ancylostoma ceylanicum]
MFAFRHSHAVFTMVRAALPLLSILTRFREMTYAAQALPPVLYGSIELVCAASRIRTTKKKGHLSLFLFPFFRVSIRFCFSFCGSMLLFVFSVQFRLFPAVSCCPCAVLVAKRLLRRRRWSALRSSFRHIQNGFPELSVDAEGVQCSTALVPHFVGWILRSGSQSVTHLCNICYFGCLLLL